jgi:hypothetical protein
MSESLPNFSHIATTQVCRPGVSSGARSSGRRRPHPPYRPWLKRLAQTLVPDRRPMILNMLMVSMDISDARFT